MKRWSFWAAIGVMLAVQGAARTLGDAAAVGITLVGTLALILIARRDDVTFADLGLAGREHTMRGLRWAALALALVGVFYTALLLSPASNALMDDRTPESWSRVLAETLVVIPIQTVLWEEVAFRGVLWAIVRRDHGWQVATIVTSVLFGFWHVVPATSFAASNEAVTSTLGSGALAATVVVVGTVLFTGLAGALLCELRRRSGSLLAPMGAHWSTNSLGLLASYLA